MTCTLHADAEENKAKTANFTAAQASLEQTEEVKYDTVMMSQSKKSNKRLNFSNYF